MKIAGVVLVLVLVGSTGIAPVPAGSPKPLRHLRFSVTGDIRTTVVDTRHGFNETGTQPSLTETHATPNGTIDVNVVSVTSDGSLALEVSETDASRTQHATPAGVFGDGYAVVNAKDSGNIDDEELALLPYLAPNLVAGHDAVAGGAWTLTHHDGTIDHTLNVRVDKLEGTLVTATVKQSILDRGVGSLTQTGLATMTYDDARTVPTSLTVSAQRSTNTSDRTTKMTLGLTYTLLEDSMAPQ